MTDERVRSVEWKDLLPLHWTEVLTELTISLPWLALSLGAYHLTATRHWGYMALGLFAAFFFFLTGLRQTHNAYHYASGVPRWAHEAIIFTLSVVMTGSMHAVQANHLHHHKHCMGEDDWEAMSARLPAWRAILLGPYFPYKLHVNAFKIGTKKQKRWVVIELIANVVWMALVFGVLDVMFLKIHVAVMLTGQCFTAFFAVWTVHHDCDRSHFIGRTVRGRLKSLLTYNMFYHVEHHLYPTVPTCHLDTLAKRLDKAAPELQERRVL
ncbi:fatty acid desaturase [Planctomycetota bacterium]|nr:fatty acid desaturase [Planctomycetota bacterium]